MQACTLTHMKAETILCFYLCFFKVMLSVANGLRKESSAFPPALQQLNMDLHHWKKSDICRIKPIFLISTAIQSTQPQKPASSFRTILSHIISCSRGCFQPKVPLGTRTHKKLWLPACSPTVDRRR